MIENYNSPWNVTLELVRLRGLPDNLATSAAEGGCTCVGDDGMEDHVGLASWCPLPPQLPPPLPPIIASRLPGTTAGARQPSKEAAALGRQECRREGPKSPHAPAGDGMDDRLPRYRVE